MRIHFISLRRFAVLLAFLAAGFLVYGSALNNNFVTWDDGLLIVDNPAVQGFNSRNIKTAFTTFDPELYIPLTLVSYQLNYEIGGYEPSIYHFTNIVIHICNGVLVAMFFGYFFKTRKISVLLGFIFLLHPLNTEAVVWGSARKDVLSTFFFLVSIVFYLRYKTSNNKLSLSASLSAFLCALLSKVMTVTLPITLLLIDYLYARKITKQTVYEKIPYFGLSFLFGVVAIFGKTKTLASSTLFEKFLMAARSSVFYLEKFVLPTGLSFAYPATEAISISSLSYLLPIILILALLGLAVVVSQRLPKFTVGFLFYATTLIPTFTNFYKGGDLYFASDRYAYIPMIGMLMMTGALAESWLSYSRSERAYSRNEKVLCASGILICLLLAGASHRQSLVWKSSESLYTHALQYYPNARAAYHNLGMEYLSAGNPQRAIKEFDAAIAINDDLRTRVSKAAALVALGKYTEAINEYNDVIAIDSDEPDAYYGLGNVAHRLGKNLEAIQHYQKAIAVRPTYTNALNNMGAIYIELQDWESAIRILEQAKELRPDFTETLYNLAGAKEHAGLLNEAELEYISALELAPTDADIHASLAWVYYKQGKIPAAVESLKTALRSNQSCSRGLSLLAQLERDGIVSR